MEEVKLTKEQEILFEVYDKGVQNEDCDLDAYVEKMKQALSIAIVSHQRELLADEKCDKLLQDLDEYARNYDGYEYGLPINFTDDTGELDEQRFLIKEWFKANCS